MTAGRLRLPAGLFSCERTNHMPVRHWHPVQCLPEYSLLKFQDRAAAVQSLPTYRGLPMAGPRSGQEGSSVRLYPRHRCSAKVVASPRNQLYLLSQRPSASAPGRFAVLTHVQNPGQLPIEIDPELPAPQACPLMRGADVVVVACGGVRCGFVSSGGGNGDPPATVRRPAVGNAPTRSDAAAAAGRRQSRRRRRGTVTEKECRCVGRRGRGQCRQPRSVVMISAALRASTACAAKRTGALASP